MDEQTTRSKSPNQTINFPEATEAGATEIRDTHQNPIFLPHSWTPIKSLAEFAHRGRMPSHLQALESSVRMTDG